MKPANSSETGVAIKGVGLLSSGRILGVLVSLASTALLARILTPADFGVFAASMVIIGLSSALFEGAFAIGLVQRQAVDVDYLSSAFWLAVILAALLVAIACVAAGPIAMALNVPGGRSIVMAASLSLLCKAVECVAVAYLRRNSRFAAISFWQFAGTLFGNGLLSVYLAYRGYGAWSLVWGQLAASVLTAGGTLAVSAMPLRFSLKRSAAMDTIATSRHFILIHLLQWSGLATTNTVIAHVLGLSVLGAYSRAMKLLDVSIRVSAEPLSSVLLPAFARQRHDREKARMAFERALNFSLPFFAVLSAASVIHAKAIVWIALGSQWSSVVPLVQMLFCVLFARGCCRITDAVALGFGHGIAVTRFQFIHAFLMIGSALLAAPFGAVWVAGAISAAAFTFYVMSLTYASRLLGVKVSALAVAHTRASVLTALAIVADVGASTLLRAGGFWAGQLAGGAAILAVLAVIVLSPSNKLLGTSGRHLLAGDGSDAPQESVSQRSRTNIRSELTPDAHARTNLIARLPNDTSLRTDMTELRL